MILSMTGFAAVARELPGVSLAVEVRSVNHRYLDLSIRLPDELRGLESALRERIAGAQKRGKVECRVALARNTPGAAEIAIDVARVAQLTRAADDIRRHAPSAPPLTTGEILRWPGVLAEPAVEPEALVREVQSLLTQALADLADSRSREGAKLVSILEERCAAIDTQIARVAPRIPALHAAYLDKLGGRLREAGLDPDHERLKQELALFATRIDVAEEISRLTTHVSEVRRVLRAGGAAGKRLDFLMQELHREANTLGSKSVDAELSQVSLELKVLIEQMREQVQNLE